MLSTEFPKKIIVNLKFDLFNIIGLKNLTNPLTCLTFVDGQSSAAKNIINSIICSYHFVFKVLKMTNDEVSIPDTNISADGQINKWKKVNY